jgi:hypothetical protein
MGKTARRQRTNKEEIRKHALLRAHWTNRIWRDQFAHCQLAAISILHGIGDVNHSQRPKITGRKIYNGQKIGRRTTEITPSSSAMGTPTLA